MGNPFVNVPVSGIVLQNSETLFGSAISGDTSLLTVSLDKGLYLVSFTAFGGSGSGDGQATSYINYNSVTIGMSRFGYVSTKGFFGNSLTKLVVADLPTANLVLGVSKASGADYTLRYSFSIIRFNQIP
jgi:hypothetical protein